MMGRHLVEQGRRQVEAAAGGRLGAAAADHQPGPLVAARGHIAAHRVELGPRHQRPHGGGRVQGVAHGDPGQPGLQRLDHRPVEVGVDEQPRGGAARLALRRLEVHAHHRLLGHIGRVGVGEDQQRVLAPQLGGDVFEHPAGRGRGHHLQPGLAPAGEADAADAGMIHQRRPGGGPVAGQHRHHPLGQHLSGQVGHLQRRDRGLVGGLHHHRVARGQRRGGVIDGEHQRMVERQDAGHHPEGLPQGHVQPPGRGGQGLAVQLPGDAREVVERVGRVGQVVAHGGQRVARVHGVDAGQPLGVGPQGVGEPAQGPAPLGRPQSGPSRLGRGRGPHRPVHRLGAGQRHPGHDLAGARRHRVHGPVAGRGQPVAADLKRVGVPQLGLGQGHGPLLWESVVLGLVIRGRFWCRVIWGRSWGRSIRVIWGRSPWGRSPA